MNLHADATTGPTPGRETALQAFRTTLAYVALSLGAAASASAVPAALWALVSRGLR